MTKIGGFFHTSTKLREGEFLAHSFLANRTQHSQRAVGGKLFFTNQRYIFLPHLFDHLFGGEKCEIERSEIQSVGIEPPNGETRSGGLRKRLKVSHSSGEDLFVVADLDDVISRVHAMGEQDA